MCADRIEHCAPSVAHFYHRFAAREMAALQGSKASVKTRSGAGPTSVPLTSVRGLLYKIWQPLPDLATPARISSLTIATAVNTPSVTLIWSVERRFEKMRSSLRTDRFAGLHIRLVIHHFDEISALASVRARIFGIDDDLGVRPARPQIGFATIIETELLGLVEAPARHPDFSLFGAGFDSLIEVDPAGKIRPGGLDQQGFAAVGVERI